MIPSAKFYLNDVHWPLRLKEKGELINRRSMQSFSYECKPMVNDNYKCELEIDFRGGEKKKDA